MNDAISEQASSQSFFGDIVLSSIDAMFWRGWHICRYCRIFRILMAERGGRDWLRGFFLAGSDLRIFVKTAG
jgi:hypothetical protein